VNLHYAEIIHCSRSVTYQSLLKQKTSVQLAWTLIWLISHSGDLCDCAVERSTTNASIIWSVSCYNLHCCVG